MPKVAISGIELFYHEQGNGEPVLLLTGFGCDHAIWGEVAAHLANNFRVIALDNRGVGQSSLPDAPITIQQMAEDAAQLLDALDITSAHVAGHSMGGMIAQELALAHPARVRSLMLISSCSQLDERGKEIIALWGELPKLVDPTTMTRILLPWIYTNNFYSRPGAIDSLMKLILAIPCPPAPQAMYDQSRAIMNCSTTSRLHNIACPTLALVGSDDIVLPVEYSRQLAQGISHAELKIINNTGHDLLVESHEQVAHAMQEFLVSSHHAPS